MGPGGWRRVTLKVSQVFDSCSSEAMTGRTWQESVICHLSISHSVQQITPRKARLPRAQRLRGIF
ncbi:hypothetical protein BT69DRAFT_1290917 [Atractiella rhizophila]|nr:hypothetical protein BT69DRAFT_1290917 [Atractiella rhizophila]